MDLEARIKEIRKEKAFEECFSKPFYTVCPIDRLYSTGLDRNYKNKKVLVAAHCIHFSLLSEEEIKELKKLTMEAILDYGKVKDRKKMNLGLAGYFTGYFTDFRG